MLIFIMKNIKFYLMIRDEITQYNAYEVMI